MTNPTITHSHILLEDCDDTTGYTENTVSMAGGDCTLTTQNHDVFQIQATFDNGATNEYCFYEKTLSGYSLSATDQYLIRYKTSAASNGAHARCELCFLHDVTGAVADDGGVTTDETTAANNTTPDDMTLLPLAPAVNDAYYFGANETFGSIELYISTAGNGNWAITWEYWNGAAWTALTHVIDNTNNFMAAVGKHTVIFDVPTNWLVTTVGGIADKYWIRGRCSAFVNCAQQPLGAFVDYIITQTILDDAYSVTWKEKDDTTTAGTLGLIRFYADDDGTDGTFYVYYDFVLLHEGTFTPPQWHTCELIMANRPGDIGIWGRVGDLDQYGGMESPIIHMDGPMDQHVDWGTPDGEYMMKIHLRRYMEQWQWLTSDVADCKVKSTRLKIGQYETSGFQRLWTWDLTVVTLSSGDATVWGTGLEWLGK